MPLSLLAQSQSQPVTPAPNPPIQADPFWSVVGQYGVGAAALLALFKAYADYQLKAAIEDRALKVKESSQDLATKERIYGSVLTQNEVLSTNQGQLLNTFIAKALNQAETTNEQITELIRTIGTLTEAIKFLSDSQNQQLDLLYEIKEAIESTSGIESKLVDGFNTAIESLTLQTNLINQLLVISESIGHALSQTNIKA